jgi:hypothetical protein
MIRPCATIGATWEQITDKQRGHACPPYKLWGGFAMKLLDIDAKTEDTFFRCLHDEKPQDPRVLALRRRWYDGRKDKGLRAKVLVLDGGEVVGLCQYLPIEYSQLIGQDLMAILCIWVHGYEHHVGNRQKQGYGRFILDCIEQDARASGVKGVAAWGMDFPYWNPVSFYEHMGYVRCDVDDPVVLVWKRFADDAAPPRLMRTLRTPAPGAGKVNVTVFHNGWCAGGCEQCVTTRKAVAGLEDAVEYHEVDASDRATMLSWGIDECVYIDDTPLYPEGPDFTVEMVQQAIRQKQQVRGL